MTTKAAPVDLELRATLDMIPSIPLNAETLAAVCQMSTAVQPDATSATVDCEEVWIDDHAGGPPFRLLLFMPVRHTGRTPALLDIHGGGYVLGSPEMDRAGHEARG